MEEKLIQTLHSPNFVSWRHQIWTSISHQALAENYVRSSEINPVDGLIDPTSARWSPLWIRLVEIKFLFRPPVARCVHARFLLDPKRDGRVDVGHLSFQTSPVPGEEEKAIFERRKAELLEWRQHGGVPPTLDNTEPTERRRSPKAR